MTHAPLGRRLGAIVYDTLLIIALLFLSTLPFVALRGGEPVAAGTLSYQLMMLGIVYLFFLLFWSRYGRTLGMQSWGLRIEDANGARPGIAACSIRFVVALLSWVPAGLGFWWQLFDREHLAWHDRASGTRLRYTPKQKQG